MSTVKSKRGGTLACLLPPDSDEECAYNDENNPGRIDFSPRSDLDDNYDLPIPIAPPRQDVLFTARTYNHGALERTPPRREGDEVCSKSIQNKNPCYQNTPPRAKHRKISSAINDEPLQSNVRIQDGYDSDNLNTRSRIAFARRQDRIVKNPLLKKIAPAFDNLRTEGSVMEKLFGDVVKPPEPMSQPIIPLSQYREVVASRKLIPSSLYLSDSSNLWIVTVDTNNGGWKAETSTFQAFSFPTLIEAREAAYSYAPPVLTPFEKSPTCFICNGKFAIFRRAVHCKSCGVCVCRKCVIQWPAKRLPQTYNHKRESKLNVCMSCNHLSEEFQDALMKGEEEGALALYETGNVNLRCPFGKDVNGEIMFPIHCAVQGGNLNLVRWLADIHFCPVFMTQLTNNNDAKDDGMSKQPLLTSKGRSALYHAMSTQQIDILRYLVCEKGMSLFEAKDLRKALLNLELALERLPTQVNQEDNRLLTIRTALYDNVVISTIGERNHEGFSGLGNGSFEPEMVAAGDCEEDDDVTVTTVNNACIICFVNVIDCVVLPCGHQICCVHCSKSMSLCPICNTKCSFMKLFKP